MLVVGVTDAVEAGVLLRVTVLLNDGEGDTVSAAVLVAAAVKDTLLLTLAPVESEAVGDTMREELGDCVAAEDGVVVGLGVKEYVVVIVVLGVTVAVLVAPDVTVAEYDGDTDRVAN
jgi:hypothetical protein